MNEKPILPAKGVRGLLRNRAGVTLGLWVLLILMFLAIWQVLQPNDGTHPRVQADESTPSMSWTYMVLPGIFFAVFSLVLAGGRRFNAANGAGIRALAEGDFARAEGEFLRVQRIFRWNPVSVYKVVASFNLALTWLYQGRFDEAVAGFERTEKSTAGRMLWPQVACYMALGYSLRGQLDPARTWLATADKRVASTAQKPYLLGIADLARAVVNLRAGRAVEAHRSIEDQWRGLEGSLTGATLRPFTVVRAFAAARAGGEREAGVSQRILQGLQPVRPGEFAMLEGEWPEMHAFLADA